MGTSLILLRKKCDYLICYLDGKPQLPETLQEGTQEAPAADGVYFVRVPAVNVGMQGAGGSVEYVTFWNKTPV